MSLTLTPCLVSVLLMIWVLVSALVLVQVPAESARGLPGGEHGLRHQQRSVQDHEPVLSIGNQHSRHYSLYYRVFTIRLYHTRVKTCVQKLQKDYKNCRKLPKYPRNTIEISKKYRKSLDPIGGVACPVLKVRAHRRGAPRHTPPCQAHFQSHTFKI